MANKHISIWIIDDSLPYQRFLNEIDDTLPISASQIGNIINSGDGWPDEEQPLKDLTNLILQSQYFINGFIDLKWILYPNFGINALKNESEIYSPDLVIYDWEYKNYPGIAPEATTDENEKFIMPSSGKSLLMLLNQLQESFFFIYSNRAATIPIELFKDKLDDYAKQFQVLPKGDNRLYLSAEEMIYNYILLRINNQEKINIGGKEVVFDNSGMLRDYTDILYLENILGKEYLKKKLGEVADPFTDAVVSEILKEFSFQLYLSADKKILISEKDPFVEKKYGPLITLSYKEAFNKYGLQIINEALNNTIIKIH